MSADAVVVRDLVRRFGEFTAVDGVSFDIRAGEIFGFLGPNGAGKTTTIKMLTGLLRPTAGHATVAGLDLASQADRIRQRIGYMSQRFSLYTDLRVEENIALFAGLYGVTGARRAARLDWVLAMAGLEEQRARMTGELALGWRQRLALGCALLHEPPVLFLDEPTSGVDPATRRSFWDLIYDLARGGTTVLVSTHYMEEAEYCDRLALLHRGRLIALDRPARLRQSMGVPILELRTSDPVRSIELLRALPGVLDASFHGRNVRVVAGEALLAAESASRTPGRLTGRAGAVEPAAAAALGRALDAAGITVASVEPVSASLDDVFAHLVRAQGGAVPD